MRTIIFSDMDGTLLNEHYSFENTKPIIKQLIALEIPIILCSSKTRFEIEYYRKKLGISDPFISENGAALFIPKGYFEKNQYDAQAEDYDIVKIGISYLEIREKLQRIKTKTNSEIIGFGDMTVEEIAQDSGLAPEMAWMSKQREYDEPFRLLSGDEQILFDAAKKEGLFLIKGDRYWHASGNHNKGTAVSLMIKRLNEHFVQIRTIGVGNGQNDIPMLELMDKPILAGKDEKLECLWRKVLTSALNLDFCNIKH
jgi:mannosyl-3-phosphoglycerate phosphatase